jgi:hypothetical protein
MKVKFGGIFNMSEGPSLRPRPFVSFGGSVGHAVVGVFPELTFGRPV